MWRVSGGSEGRNFPPALVSVTNQEPKNLKAFVLLKNIENSTSKNKSKKSNSTRTRKLCVEHLQLTVKNSHLQSKEGAPGGGGGGGAAGIPPPAAGLSGLSRSHSTKNDSISPASSVKERRERAAAAAAGGGAGGAGGGGDGAATGFTSPYIRTAHGVDGPSSSSVSRSMSLPPAAAAATAGSSSSASGGYSPSPSIEGHSPFLSSSALFEDEQIQWTFSSSSAIELQQVISLEEEDAQSVWMLNLPLPCEKEGEGKWTPTFSSSSSSEEVSLIQSSLRAMRKGIETSSAALPITVSFRVSASVQGEGEEEEEVQVITIPMAVQLGMTLRPGSVLYVSLDHISEAAGGEEEEEGEKSISPFDAFLSALWKQSLTDRRGPKFSWIFPAEFSGLVSLFLQQQYDQLQQQQGGEKVASATRKSSPAAAFSLARALRAFSYLPLASGPKFTAAEVAKLWASVGVLQDFFGPFNQVATSAAAAAAAATTTTTSSSKREDYFSAVSLTTSTLGMIPSNLWDSLLNLQDVALDVLRGWILDRSRAGWWESGSEYTYSRMRAGLLGLSAMDVASLIPTYRFSRSWNAISALSARPVIEPVPLRDLRRNVCDPSVILPAEVREALSSLKKTKGMTSPEFAVAVRSSAGELRRIVNALFPTIFSAQAAFNNDTSSSVNPQVASLLETSFAAHAAAVSLNVDISRSSEKLAESSLQVEQFLVPDWDPIREIRRNNYDVLGRALSDEEIAARDPFTKRAQDAILKASRVVDAAAGVFGDESGGAAGGVLSRTSSSFEGASLQRSASASVPRDTLFSVSTMAGHGMKGFIDGRGVSATALGGPQSAATLLDGRVIFVEPQNNAVRIIDSACNLSTLIGKLGCGYEDGPVATAKVNRPRGVCVCADGSVIIADSGNHLIRRISADLSHISTLAGVAGRSGLKGGPASSAVFHYPAAVLEYPGFGIIVADRQNHAIRVIRFPDGYDKASSATVETLAGDQGKSGHVDGPIGTHRLRDPCCIALAPADIWPKVSADAAAGAAASSATFKFSVLISEGDGNCVRSLNVGTTVVTTIVGHPKRPGHEDGDLSSASFSSPSQMLVSEDGTIIIADSGSNSIRLISPEGAGSVSTACGSLEGERGAADGHGYTARFSSPYGLAFSSDGGVIVTEMVGHSIRYLGLPSRLACKDQKDFATSIFARIFRGLATRISIKRRLEREKEVAQQLEEMAKQTASLVVSQADAISRCLFSLDKAVAFQRSASFETEGRTCVARADVGALRCLIASAPDFSSLASILSGRRWSSREASMFTDDLTNRLRGNLWPSEDAEAASEVNALFQLANLGDGHLIDHKAVTLAFRAHSFRVAPTTPSVLQLISRFGVRTMSVSKIEEENVKEFRKAVAAWMTRLFTPTGDVSKLEIFQRILSIILQTWVEVLESSEAQSLPPHLGRSLIFAIQAHLDEFCLMGRKAPYRTLATVGPCLATFPVSLPPTLLSVLANTVCGAIPLCSKPSIACALALGVVIKALDLNDENTSSISSAAAAAAAAAANGETKEETASSSNKQQQQQFEIGYSEQDLARMPPLQRAIICHVLAGTAEQLSDILLASQNKARRPAEGHLTVPVFSIDNMLGSNSEAWVYITRQVMIERELSQLNKATPESSLLQDAQKRLFSVADRPTRVLLEAAEVLRTGRCTMEAGRSCNSSRGALTPFWNRYAESSTVEALDLVQDDMDDIIELLDRLRTICLEFFPDSDLLRRIVHVNQLRDRLSLALLRQFLCMQRPTDVLPKAGSADRKTAEMIAICQPLPSSIVAASEWLHSLLRVPLFLSIWRREMTALAQSKGGALKEKPVAEEEEEEKPSSLESFLDPVELLQIVCKSWRTLFETLSSEQISSEWLDTLHQPPPRRPTGMFVPASTASAAAAASTEATTTGETSTAAAAADDSNENTIDGDESDDLDIASANDLDKIKKTGGQILSDQELQEQLLAKLPLGRKSDIVALAATAPCAGDNLAWEIIPADTEWVDSVVIKMERWRHVRALFNKRTRVQENLNNLEPFIDREGQDTLTELKRKFFAVVARLSVKKEWGKTTLQDVLSMWPESKALSAVLHNFDEKFLESMVASLDLLTWLRSLANDSDFNAGIEMAMNKPEMECPPELWEQSGRPDEQKLSMLMTVRMFLHPFLYRPMDVFLSAESLLSRLEMVKTPDARVREAIKTCNELRLPLMELLEGDADDAAINRLLQLRLPSREAVWIVSFAETKQQQQQQEEETDDKAAAKKQNKKKKSSHDDSSSTSDDLVSLRYVVPRPGGKIASQQSIGEVLDFQSTVVLSKSVARAADTQTSIDTFIAQLSFVRQVAHNLSLLKTAGHFAYQSFHWETALAHSEDEAQSMAIETKQELVKWQQCVQQAREQYYFLNFFSLAHVGRIIGEMKQPSSSSSSSSSCLSSALRSALLLVDPQATDKQIADFSHILSTKLGGKEQIESLTAHDLLHRFGSALQNACTGIDPRTRPLSIDSVHHVATEDVVTNGIHLIVTDSTAEVTDQVLSAYARSGSLPEREQLLLCRADTSIEDVVCFLFRWAGASKNSSSRVGRLYCLAHIELLGYEAQSRAAALIIDYGSQARDTPLLVISASSQGQFLVSQLSYARSAVTAYPITGLRQICSTFPNIFAHVSAAPGAGKSFAIRLRAAKEKRRYVHVRINSALPTSELLKLIDSVNAHSLSSPPDNSSLLLPLLHFDVASSVSANFNTDLLELILLSSLVDIHTGVGFFWRGGENPLAIPALAVEISCGGVATRIRAADVLPPKLSTANEASFVTDPESLRLGMGPAYFSTRSDGCSRGGDSAGGGGGASAGLAIGGGRQKSDTGSGSLSYGPMSTADRLIYVCGALDILASGEESGFPPLYNGPTEERRAHLTPERCFQLVIQFTQMTSSPSLWCFWNFINVFSWQLREIHHPDSPVLHACMPEAGSHGSDRDEKARIKAELIHFLIRTAKSFATRLSREIDLDRVVAVQVSGMSRVEFNRQWRRADFDNDGQPAFYMTNKNVTFFLYFRQAEKCWVIDDIVVREGTSFSCSEGPDINGKWTTSASWTEDRQMNARAISNPDGHLGQAIEIRGCADPDHNGTYLRQPPYDNIDGQPHYIMQLFNKTTRRHLFWNAGEQSWRICPVCNEDGGLFAQSMTSRLEGKWMSIPPDIVERHHRFEMIIARSILENVQEAELREEASAAEREAAALVGGAALDLLRWNDDNHECMLFSNETHVVNFLSLDPSKLRAQMHPMLLRHLVQNRIVVGEELDDLNSRFVTILGSLTNRTRTPEEASQLMGGNYCLTGDALLKMLAIFVRIRCGIPVVLMGECGCGKTMLISYLCAWLGVVLRVLDVHGGTTESDILGIFAEANDLLESGQAEQVYVFLDEINTCAHMGLLTEAICQRTLNGVPIPDQIQILAALNPYRKRPVLANEASAGLVFQLHGQSNSGVAETPDPMASLVYRVHPVPPTLRDFIFDFGSLPPNAEKQYIRSMVEKQTGEAARPSDVEVITELISASQLYIRHVEQEDSSVSLRDVQRVLSLINFFLQQVLQKRKKTGEDKEEAVATMNPIAISTILSLAHVYLYRLRTSDERTGFWTQLRDTLSASGSRQAMRSGWAQFKVSGKLESIVEGMQKRFCDHMEIEDGIALNQALMENLFVVVICLLNRIPVFLVGKPGTSKTLTLQVLASNLQGPQSPNRFWRKFPSVYIVQYQCSPMSSSDAILHQFETAKSYQKHARDSITVLLLDEVGLAEHSPSMPLKCLHGMLVNPPIAIVGISNWVLDSAKMNRCVMLNRVEPSEADIQLTGQRIVAPGSSADGGGGGAAAAGGGDIQRLPSSSGLTRTSSGGSRRLAPWLAPLSRAYHRVYLRQQGRDFIGMRDYYSLVKQLRAFLASSGIPALDWSVLRFFICRNFGGRPDVLQQALREFASSSFPDDIPVEIASWFAEMTAREAEEEEQLRALETAAAVSQANLEEERYRWRRTHRRVLNDEADDQVLTLLSLTADTAAKALETAKKKAGKFAAEMKPPDMPTPRVLKLISENLKDPNSRHLMLLTQGGAALSLLIGCKILSETAPILVGSQFSEDASELQLVQQINEVKQAMASGSVIVLLNHDNIYEALYDVLNQRYVTKNDEKTGRAKKMLRLAIGTRSQLCPVAPGFKIIVIVEQQHAYSNLDLPLINRFEKQILCHSDVLGKRQQELVARLEQWVQQVVSESGMESIQHTFCGWHRGTLPSLVLEATQFNDDWSKECLKGVVADGYDEEDDGDEDSLMDRMIAHLKSRLTRLALPLAYLKSESLEAASNYSYFDEHADFVSYLTQRLLVVARNDVVDDSTSEGAAGVVLTHSPPQDLRSVIGDEKLSHVQTRIVPLAELTSEKQLVNVAKEFFEEHHASHGSIPSGSKDRLLLVMCDPSVCSNALIGHAMRVCAQQRSRAFAACLKRTSAGEDSGATASSSSSCARRHVVFLIHLAPSVTEKDRFHPVDFENPWTFAFVDDLRPAAQGEPQLETMLKKSAFELSRSGYLDVEHILQPRWTTALACISTAEAPADLSPELFTYPSRIQMIAKLRSVPAFSQLVHSLVIGVLDSNGSVDSSGQHLHVSMAARREVCAGSLRQSLLTSLSLVCTRALAAVLRFLDADFALSALAEDIEISDTTIKMGPFAKLWFVLSKTPSLVDAASIARSCSLLTRVTEVSHNSGGNHGPIRARFPYSWRICKYLAAEETRDSVVSRIGSSSSSALISLFSESSKIASELLSNMLSAAKGDLEEVGLIDQMKDSATNAQSGYLLDVVSSTAPTLPDLSVADQCAIYRSVLQATCGPTSLQTIGGIHAAIWCNSELLFHLCALSSAAAAPPNVRTVVRQTIRNLDSQQIISPEKVASLVLSAIFEVLWESISSAASAAAASGVAAAVDAAAAPTSAAALREWPSVVDTARADIEVLLTSCCHASLQPEVQKIGRLLTLRWAGVLAMSLILKLDPVPTNISPFIAPCREKVPLSFPFVPELFALVTEQAGPDSAAWFTWRYLEEVLFKETLELSVFQFVTKCILDEQGISANIRRSLANWMFTRNEPHAKVTLDQAVRSEEKIGGKTILHVLENQCAIVSASPSTIAAEKIPKQVIESALPANPAESIAKAPVDFLSNVAQLRVFATNFAVSLIKVAAKEPLAVADNTWFPAGLSPAQLSGLRDFILTVIAEQGGIDLVASVLQSSDVSWLGLDNTLVHSQLEKAVGLNDPFLWLGSNYKEICSALRLGFRGDRQRLEDVGKLLLKMRKSLPEEMPYKLLSGALFSQFTVQRAVLPEAVISAVSTWGAQWGAVNVSSLEARILGWICDGCQWHEDARVSERIPTPLEKAMLQQVASHFVSKCAPFPLNYFTMLLSNPEAVEDVFVPTMPGDDRQAVLDAMGAVGFYMCPNRHAYCVGECTRPMQLAKCPECGAPIGGSNHVPVAGVKAVAKSSLVDQSTGIKRGFVLAAIERDELERPVSPLTIKVLRLMTYMALLVGLSIHSDAYARQVSKFTLFLNSVLNSYVPSRNFGVEKLHTPSNRVAEEVTFDSHVFTFSFKGALAKSREALRDGVVVSSVTAIIGHDRFCRVFDPLAANKIDYGWIWQYRVVPTLRHVQQSFKSHPSIASTYPLLATFFRVERRLGVIAHMVDVLQWHRVLFEAIPAASITRDEAQQITNEEVIERLPESKRAAASAILDAYCFAFNKTFPFVTNLFECQANPFVNNRGEVDLSGTRCNTAPMERTTPISFSLPSVVQGEQDAQGLCTIQLLNLMSDTHNTVLDALENPDSEEANNNGGAAAAPWLEEIPLTNYLTDSDVLRNQLIQYNREKDFPAIICPFLTENVSKDSELVEMSYDWRKIQKAVSSSLLPGRLPINIQVRQFQFAGELRRTGRLGLLQQRVAQADLSQSAKSAITAEVGTMHQLARLFASLEDAIGFLTTIGGTAVIELDPDMMLWQYITQTLRIPHELWEQSTTPAVTNMVRLKHLQSLFLLLEELQQGKASDRVAPQYREPLSDELMTALKVCLPQMDCAVLIPVLQEFMTGQLAAGTWPPSESLKDYLVYSTDLPLDDEDGWYQQFFPEDLTLAHCAATFDFISGRRA